MLCVHNGITPSQMKEVHISWCTHSISYFFNYPVDAWHESSIFKSCWMADLYGKVHKNLEVELGPTPPLMEYLYFQNSTRHKFPGASLIFGGVILRSVQLCHYLQSTAHLFNQKTLLRPSRQILLAIQKPDFSCKIPCYFLFISEN